MRDPSSPRKKQFIKTTFIICMSSDNLLSLNNIY